MKELDLVLKSIKNKAFLPIYFFSGEEPFFIDVAVKSFENDVLEEDEKAFNQTVVYGKDTTFSEVLALARQFPMMGDKQVIIVKEAQDILLNEKESDALKSYCENPVDSTLLVIAYKYKKVDARKSFVKTLKKNNMFFESKKIWEDQVPQWIEGEIKKLGLKSKPNIPLMLAEYLGTDLSRISNELNKLKMILKEGEELDEKVIETNIGISKEFNVFELIKALGRKDVHRAIRVAHFIGKAPKQNPFPMIMGAMYGFFSNLIIFQATKGQNPKLIQEELKLNYYQYKDIAEAQKNYSLKHSTRILSILREIDLKNKGLGAVNTDDSELLMELTYKILTINQLQVKV